MSGMSLEFSMDSAGCCALCNPVCLADFETPCATIRGVPSGRTVQICMECFRAIDVVASTGNPVTRELDPEIVKLAKSELVVLVQTPMQGD